MKPFNTFGHYIQSKRKKTLTMAQIFDNEYLQGKQISFVDNEDVLFIKFSDGDFVIFYTPEGSESIYLSTDNLDLIPNKYNYCDLYRWGFLDVKTYLSIKLDLETENKDDIMRSEINQLQKLRSKYPNI